jgi:hypothetical protein
MKSGAPPGPEKMVEEVAQSATKTETDSGHERPVKNYAYRKASADCGGRD